MNYDSIRDNPFWWLAGLVLTAFTFIFIHKFIGTFVFGLFFYYITRPVYRHIYKHIRHRSIAAAFSLIVVALPLIGLLVWIGFAAIREYRAAENNLPLADQLEPLLGPLPDISSLTTPSDLSLSATFQTAQNAFDITLQYASVFGIGFTHMFLMIVIAFYLLRDDHRVSNWFRSFDNNDGLLDRYMNGVDEDLHHIFFGNILNAVFAGIIAAILYSGLAAISPPGLRIPYPVLVGALVGLASLIPLVGMKIIYVPVSAYLIAVSLISGTWDTTYWFPITFLIFSIVLVDGIPDLILRPYVSGKNTHIGLLMGAYILGPFMFGWYGLFLAPMILVLTAQYAKIILPSLLENPQKNTAMQLIGIDPVYLPEEPPETTE